MGITMSKAHDAVESQAQDDLDQDESLKRMIFFTKREAEKDGRTFCAYLLDLALNALNEDNAEMNMALKAKITPLTMELNAGKSKDQPSVGS
ncbi:hypothetical protein [Roseibium sp.]|uniref:hypothetical protein n=2 Tax=Roseibium sp. TaxID=1936156 RepID=UPI0032980313